MRTRWLEELESQMDRVSTQELKATAEGLSPPEPRERVIGKASDAVLRLWVVVQKGRLVIDGLLTQHLSEKGLLHDHGDCGPFLEKLTPLIEGNKTAKEVFWRSLRAEAELPYGNIGVRKDGVVVTWEEEEQGDILDLMKELTEELRRVRS